MSDDPQSKVKDKPTVGNKLRTIFSKNPAKVEQKKQKKAAQERYKDASKAIDKWRGQDVSKLGWMVDEHDRFTTLLASAKDLEKSDPGVGADKLVEAKGIAEKADAAKLRRTEVKRELLKVYEPLKPLQRERPDVEECYRKAGVLRQKLDEGVSPDLVQTQLDELGKEIGLAVNATPKGATGSGQSTLEKTRTELQVAFNGALDDEVDQSSETVMSVIAKGSLVFPQADVRTQFRARVRPIYMTLDQSSDSKSLTGEPALLDDLRKRGVKAMTDLANNGKAYRKEILADKGKAFVATVKQGEEVLRKSGELSEAAAKFEKDFVAVEQALSRLQDTGTPDAVGIGKDVVNDRALMLSSNSFGKAPLVIESLLAKIARAQDKAVSGAKGDAGKLEQELADLRGELKNQMGAADSRFKPAYKALIEELDRLDTVVATNNLGAFASARQQMADIRKTALGGVGAVVKTLDDIAAVTGNKFVVKEFQSENNEIKLALKTVTDDLDLHELSKAAKTLTDVKRDADALKLKADELLAWRGEVKDRLAALAKMIEGFRKLVPKSVGQTTFELNAAKVKEQYGTVGVERADVELLLQQAEGTAWPLLNNLKAGGESMHKALESLGVDVLIAKAQVERDGLEASEKEQAHQKLETDLKKYQIDLKRVSSLVDKAKPAGDTEELSELKTLGEQAEKKFKNGDEKGARSQLDSIRKRLDRLEQTPGGVTAASVKVLAEVGGLWQNALDDMRKQLTGVQTPAALAAVSIRLDDAAVSKRIDDVYDRLAAFTLVQSIRVLADDTADIKVRKQARETALRDVRAMRGIIASDKMIAKLSVNPFPVDPPFRKLAIFLDNMEYNSLRAVPVE